MRFDEKFAKRLQYVRSERGLSQQELSKQSGIAQAQLSRYEAGTNKPRPHILTKLAQTLEVSASWLATGEIPISASEDYVTITTSVPFGIADSLAEEAQKNDRLLSEEIYRRLERSFFEPMTVDVVTESGEEISLSREVIEAAKMFANKNQISLSEEIVLTLRKAYFGVIAGSTLDGDALLKILNTKAG